MGARQTSFSCVLFDFAFLKFLHSSSKTLEAMISAENVAKCLYYGSSKRGANRFVVEVKTVNYFLRSPQM